MVVPNFVLVEDDSSSKAPSWVDASSGDGNGSQMNHENSKPNRQWSQNLKQEYSFQPPDRHEVIK